MTDCKTIHLSDKDICLVIDALVQARVGFELDAEKYRQTWEVIREEAYHV